MKKKPLLYLCHNVYQKIVHNWQNKWRGYLEFEYAALNKVNRGNSITFDGTLTMPLEKTYFFTINKETSA